MISFKRLLGNVDGSDANAKPQIFTCNDGTGADECTVLGTGSLRERALLQAGL